MSSSEVSRADRAVTQQQSNPHIAAAADALVSETTANPQTTTATADRARPQPRSVGHEEHSTSGDPSQQRPTRKYVQWSKDMHYSLLTCLMFWRLAVTIFSSSLSASASQGLQQQQLTAPREDERADEGTGLQKAAARFPANRTIPGLPDQSWAARRSHSSVPPVRVGLNSSFPDRKSKIENRKYR